MIMLGKDKPPGIDGLRLCFRRVFAHFWLGVFLFLCGLLSLPASAFEPIHLFSNGKQVQNYNTLLSTLTPGMTLAFDDGTLYEYLGALTSGRTTKIIRVRPLRGVTVDRPVVIRLPLSNGVFKTNSQGKALSYTDFISFFISSIPSLEKAKLIPKVFSKLENQYVLIEEVNVRFTLTAFLENSVKLSLAERRQAFEALREFALKTAAFRGIGDFYTHNIIFDGRQWVLLDFTRLYLFRGKMELAQLQEHPFRFLFELLFRNKHESAEAKATSRRLQMQIEGIVNGAREKMLSEGINPISETAVSLIPSLLDRQFQESVYEGVDRIALIKKCATKFSELQPQPL